MVIAIIALLIGILLPALGAARQAAQATIAQNNARSVAIGVINYTLSSEVFPPAYVYGAAQDGGEWRLQDQRTSHPTPSNGYVHWSYSLFSDGGGIPQNAFEDPRVLRRGAPATNPGGDIIDWEDGQQNDLGQSSPASLPIDRQAKRIAFAGNAAIFPRNKFSRAIGTPRLNRLVRVSEVENTRLGSSKVILVCQFFDNGDGWTSLADNDYKIKSHRPISPFVGLSSGSNVYNEPLGAAGATRFRYPTTATDSSNPELRTTIAPGERGLIDDSNTVLNAVGRHHSSGTSMFGFVDGHVEQLTVQETVDKRLWGDRYWSLSGNNRVSIDGRF